MCFGNATNCLPDRIQIQKIEKHSLRYVDFVGDGDCSSHQDVVKSKPYGDELTVQKVECVGHIKKRTGRRLRGKKKDMKGKKLSDGKTIGAHNHLTDNLIDTFQRYYGKALRENKGDLTKLQKAVKAIWHHYASTEDKELHDYCPEGAESWCKWQKRPGQWHHLLQTKECSPSCNGGDPSHI